MQWLNVESENFNPPCSALVNELYFKKVLSGPFDLILQGLTA